MKRFATASLATLLLTSSVARADDDEPRSTHAPDYALWAGVRASFIGFGFGFFENDPRRGLPSGTETTGNFVGSGFAPELDLGARLAKRFVPYVFWEHGFLARGHRFEGSDATASTSSAGVGLRFGGADRFGFIADLSIGKRWVSVSRGNDTFTMSSLEVFKLALGAELRFSTLFTVEATLNAGGGAMNDASGDVTYSAKGSSDGRTHPAYENGAIDRDSATYIVFGAGLGIHFDVFGE